MYSISEKLTYTHLAALFALAASITFLNCLKPLHLDDPAYYYYAAHIAQQPLSPYGFEVHWDYRTQPANHLLAPPLLLYWWATAIAWCGDSPFLWKLWLLPFHLLLVFALHGLCRRFAPGLALLLVTLMVLSPALLPGLNLMLDVPALALALTAVTMFLNGSDRQSWPRILLAGLLAGLAMQTKYSSFVTPLVFLAYGGTQRRWRFAVVAGVVAWMVFASWECFVFWRHGESHFLVGLTQRSGATHGRLRPLVLALFTMMGGLAPGVLLMGLAALTHSWRVVTATAVAVLLGCVLLGWLPEQLWQAPEVLVFGSLGLVLWGCLAVVVWRLTHGGNAVDWFLVLWLLVEVAGYFALSPFPAARRLLGVFVVVTLLVGRLATRSPDRCRRMVRLATVVSGVVGLGLALLDLREATAAQEAVERVSEVTGAQSSPTWLLATWGVQFYGCRAGMKPLTPGWSRLHQGDLLVVAEQQVIRPDLRLEQAPLQQLHTVTIADQLPFCTVLCYYGGGTALQHHAGPRLRLTVYRVLADFVPSQHGEAAAGIMSTKHK